MGIFSKKYIYVYVCFPHGKHPYSYRTKDRSIRINDVVIVPAGDEQKVAIVTSVREYEKKDVPYPVEQTKEVIRKATRSEGEVFKGVDMRMTIDISMKSVRTANRYVEVVTTAEERKALRAKYKNSENFKIIETRPVSQAYKITDRSESRKLRKTGVWHKEEHLFGSPTYRCSRCGARYSDRQAVCSKCGSENGKVKNDPVWVDEMSMYDGE